MMRELTPEHKAAMQRGRAKARIKHASGAQKRVRDWERWMKAGFPRNPEQNYPVIPSSADYASLDS